MPNQITITGIEIQTLKEVLAELTAGFKTIYGSDINLDPNSPDGQLLNLFAQGKVDMLEFIVGVYNNFDPDVATGTSLDLRCAINGVKRKPGSYTTLAIDVTTNNTTQLIGLDLATEPFTVSDAAGNKYYLTSTTSLGVGTFNLLFRAATYGAISPSLNTITNVDTPTFGVVSVTNATPVISVGTAKETDAALRLRRAASVALPSRSWYEGLYATLIESGATDARVYENLTNAVDSNGIPAHGIWVIIDDPNLLPTATTEQKATYSKLYADLIYLQKNAGCDIKAHTTNGYSVDVTQPDGTLFTIDFDIPNLVPLYVAITATPLPDTPGVDTSEIKQLIYNYFQLGDGRYKIGQAADSSAIIAYLKSQKPLISFSAEGVSMDDITYVPLIPIDNTGGRPPLYSRWNLGDSYSAGQIKVNGV